MSLRALVIDDDTASRFIFEQILSSHGFDVECAGDGADALERLGSESFDLVILDLLLPLVSGIELLAYIRQADHLRHTEVVIVSAHVRLRDRLGLAPTDIFLSKPVASRDIRAMADRVMSRIADSPS